MSSLQEKVQSLDLDSPIDLFSITTAGAGGVTIYFTNISGVVFGGQVYTPIPCEFEWLALTSEGAVPTSRLIISDVSGIIGAIAQSYNLIGATLTAMRTYTIFLDTQPSSDPTQFMAAKLRINKRTWDCGNTLELECITGFDIERRKIPSRSYLRRCSFLLSDENCRASTAIHYDLAGNPTSAQNRACGKDTASCMRYHGTAWGRFYGGFLGASRR